MGLISLKRNRPGPAAANSEYVGKLTRLATPDVALAAEQFVMAAAQDLSKFMASEDPQFWLEKVSLDLDQAKAAVEVLQHRG